jgi:hypothetical protein
MKTIQWIFVLFLLASSTLAYAQCGMIPHPMESRITESDLVIEAEVVAQQGMWNADRSMIYTINTLKVFKVFKGSSTAQFIEVLTKGGTVGLTHDRVSIALELNIGDTGVFTLANSVAKLSNELQAFEVVSSQQGFLRYSRLDGSARDFQMQFSNIAADVYPFIEGQTRSTYHEIVPLEFSYPDGTNRNNRMAVVITSFSTSVGNDATGNAGVGEILTINGTGFGAAIGTVFFENANAGGGLTSGLYTNEMINWTDTQIQVEIPTAAGTGSFAVQEATNTMNDIQAGLTIGFSHLNVQFDGDSTSPGSESWEIRLVDDNGTGGYTSRYNTEFVATPGAADTYEDLISTWRCSTGVSFIRGDDTTEDNDPSANMADGINVVRFDNTTELGGSTLAYALSRFSGCFVATDVVEWHVIEIDVVVNDDVTWYYGDALPVPFGEFDFETVILHELGHGHLLGHVIDVSQVMHFAIGSGAGSEKRALSPTDLEGGNFVMNKSTTFVACGESVMTVATPTAVCRDFTIALDDDGVATITTDDLDNGSTADCLTITSFSADQLTFDCSDIGTQNITLTVNFSDGSSDTCVSAVTIEGGGAATWQAGAWLGGVLPTGASAVTINDDLDIGFSNIKGCSCTITTGNTLTIGAGGYLETYGDITVDGSLIVEHEGSVVQRDNAAAVTKGGSGIIEVRKTTPTLAPLGFMFMSSPMTAETRDGAYGSGFRIIEVVSSAFTVDPALETMDPMDPYFGTEIFLGANNSFLANYTGSEALVAGDGLVVYPQSSISDGGTSYDLVYTKGVLNNGSINYPIQYNGVTKNNFNLMGNPYPSAINAIELINANDMINEVFFWEHITAPANTIPGYLTNNYSMNDISMYNLSGGMAATNPGGTTPNQFIASGQGFAIKAVEGGAVNAVFTNAMRETGNNDQYRNPEQENRVWLSIHNDEYSLKGQTLLAFLPEATVAMNPGYDSKRIAGAISLFTSLKSGEQLGIQGREVFDVSMQIPVGFASAIEGDVEFHIEIDALQGGGIENVPVYLVDTWTGTYVNLKERGFTFKSGRTLTADRFMLTFETPDVLSVEGVDTLEQGVKLYPNPTNGLVTLAYAGDQRLEGITIVDMQGKLVYEETLNAFSRTKVLNVNNLSSGIYFVRVRSTEQSVVQKLIVK